MSKGTIKRRSKIYPMIHKSLLTSEELSGIKAMKAHYLLINQNLKGLKISVNVVNFSGLGEYIYLPLKHIVKECFLDYNLQFLLDVP